MSAEAGSRRDETRKPTSSLVGEIRDAETARMAVNAALTGHLLLSILPTNDEPSRVHRLMTWAWNCTSSRRR